jgi:4'-phosphopantetheinyl transferase
MTGSRRSIPHPPAVVSDDSLVSRGEARVEDSTDAVSFSALLRGHLARPSSNVVDVWVTDLREAFGPPEWARNVLDEAEVARSESYRYARDRERFVATHARLRVVLAAYLGCRADRVQLTGEPGRKPRLLGHSSDALSFSVSHSDNLAVVAVASASDVGVDIESVEQIRLTESLLRAALSGGERRAIRALPEERQPESFYRLWTAKEAYLKAIGTGLSDRLDSVEMLVDGTGRVSLRADRFNPAAPWLWTIQRFGPREGYVGHVAVEGELATVNVYHLR